VANSGTEEEFNRVVDRHRSGESVSVCFLFKSADVPIKLLDGEQFLKVQRFKEYVSECGCLYREYIDDSSLINSLNLILDKFANAQGAHGAGSRSGSHENGRRNAKSSVVVPSSPLSPRDTDDGLFEVNDRIEADGKRFVQAMEDWTKRLTQAGEVAEQVTDELNTLTRFGLSNNDSVRAVIEKMTRNLTDFAEWGEIKIAEVEDIIDRYSDSFLKLVDISHDFPESVESMESAKNSMLFLSDQIVSNSGSMNDFIATLKETPRLSKPMIKAVRRLIDIHKRLVAKNEIFRSNVLEVAAQIDAMIDGRSLN